MPRQSNFEVHNAFVEFEGEDQGTKCNKVRCKHCGFVRAKNTTRQIEHLQECSSYLNSPEGRALLSAPVPAPSTPMPASSMQSTLKLVSGDGQNIWMGKTPNPNLMVHRRGPNKRNRDGSAKTTPVQAAPKILPRPAPTPSLAGHLLQRDPIGVSKATQHDFLSHAGTGTLDANALSEWLAQDSHISRGYISFAGALISKIRLPQASNVTIHPLYRTMDLLISVLTNARREMSFFEITAAKYGLHVPTEVPSPITRSYLDLFNAASSPSASLLEGMVVLWATEHCYRASWTFASTFSGNDSSPFLPPYPSVSSESHIAALHQALIPNWTSAAFAKFVDACQAVVDELANAQTSGNGREEMTRCEGNWKQVIWLWERRWPSIDVAGRQDESRNDIHGSSNGQTRTGNGPNDPQPLDDDNDDDDDADADADDVQEVSRPGSTSVL